MGQARLVPFVPISYRLVRKQGVAMTKAPRENRVPIMMSEEELAAIDDWRFANRVATRSDAVRRLCQIGLEADATFEKLEKSIDQRANKQAVLVSSIFSRVGKHKTQADLVAMYIELMEAFSSSTDDMFSVAQDMREAATMSAAFRAPGSMEELSRDREKIAEQFAKAREIIAKSRPTQEKPE